MATETTTESGQTIIIQQPRESMFGRMGKFLLIALAFAILACIGMYSASQSYFNKGDGPQEKYHSLSETATKKIAIINITGTILETDDFVKKQIDRVKEDKSVVAVVLRINSPGGTVTYSDYLYHHLRLLADDEERPLPMVVSMGSLCASGGYYVAMAVGEKEDVIFAEPTTWTGSIGVIIPHYDLSGLMTEWNVTDDSVMSHPLKDMGSPTQTMTDEERAILQELVDESFEHFKEIVRSGRPKLAANEADLDAVATGQIFTASQAEQLGLVDKKGFIEDAVARAVELTEFTADEVRCVEYKKPPSAFGELFGQTQVRQSSLPVDALLELSTPRAYYLCTLLPALLESGR